MEKKFGERAILQDLCDDGAAYRARGVAKCIHVRKISDTIADALKALKYDPAMILGRPLGDYAIAALDITGSEKYMGKDQSILELIEELPDTFADGAVFPG